MGKSNLLTFLNEENEPLYIKWLGCGNCLEVQSIVTILEAEHTETFVAERFHFELIEIEEDIVKSVEERNFFQTRTNYISVTAGNACIETNWLYKHQQNSIIRADLLYFTLVSGPVINRIVAYIAIKLQIPEVVSFEDNFENLLASDFGKSHYFYNPLLYNCGFSKSNEQRSLFNAYILKIDPEHLYKLIFLDHLRTAMNFLESLYGYLDSNGTMKDAVMNYISPLYSNIRGIIELINKSKASLNKEKDIYQRKMKAAFIAYYIAKKLNGEALYKKYLEDNDDDDDSEATAFKNSKQFPKAKIIGRFCTDSFNSSHFKKL